MDGFVGRILDTGCPNQLTLDFIGLIKVLPELKKCPIQTLWFGSDSDLVWICSLNTHTPSDMVSMAGMCAT